MSWPSTSFMHAFTHYLQIQPMKVMIRHCRTDQNDELETYQEFASRVIEILNFFEEQKMRKGDKVVCYTKENNHLLPFYLACGFFGLVPLPITDAFSPSFVAKTAAQCQARWIMTDDNTIKKFARTDLKFISTTRDLPAKCEITFNVDEAVQILTSYLSQVDLNSMFFLQPTSGSTGVPKLVMRSHLASFRHARYLSHELTHLQTEGPMTLMLTAAITHTFPLHIAGVAFSLGIPIIFPTQIDSNFSLEELTRTKPTIFACVPRVITSLYKQALARTVGGKNVFESFLFPHTKVLLSGGGTPDESIIDELTAARVETITIFGSSESSLMAYSPYKNRKAGYAGKIVDDVEIKLAEDKEILIRSPGMMLGYFGYSPEQMKELHDSEGFFYTGDMGEISEDHYIKIVGRKKDVYSTFTGYYIYPERIETRLERSPSIDQAVLIGDRRPYNIAILFLKDNKPRTLDDYVPELFQLHALVPEKVPDLYEQVQREIEQVNESLEPLEQIKKFVLVNSFPSLKIYKNLASGKIRKQRQVFASAYTQEIDFMYSDLFNYPCFATFNQPLKKVG